MLLTKNSFTFKDAHNPTVNYGITYFMNIVSNKTGVGMLTVDKISFK